MLVEAFRSSPHSIPLQATGFSAATAMIHEAALDGAAAAVVRRRLCTGEGVRAAVRLLAHGRVLDRYKAMFGELPSQTLAGSRSRAARRVAS
jgi:hypothetical protein